MFKKQRRQEAENQSHLLPTNGSYSTNEELLQNEYYPMMDSDSKQTQTSKLCDKHREKTEKQVPFKNETVKIEANVEDGLIPIKMKGSGQRCISNIKCFFILLCFFIVFILCIIPIFFSLKHTITGKDEKHGHFSIMGD